MPELSPRQFKDYTLRYQHQPNNLANYRAHSITALHDDKAVGRLEWSGGRGEVSWVGVNDKHQGKGLASAMWEMGRSRQGTIPHHSPVRTTMGDHWARSTGASLPRMDYDEDYIDKDVYPDG